MKYWLEDNKDKLYIGGAVVALGLLGVGIYNFVDKDKEYNIGEGVEITMADYMLTQKLDGDLALVDVEENEVTSTYNLHDDSLTFYGENLDEMYVYIDNSVSSVSVKEGGELELVNGITVPELENVGAIQTGGGHFGFLTPEELVITNENGEPVIVFEDNESNVYHLTDKGVYLAMDTEIHFVDYGEGETKYIDIGDVTTKFSRHGETIVARNDFGKGEDTQTVLNIENGDLHIDELKRVQYDNKLDINVPANENQIVYIQHVVNKDGDITRQDLATLSVNEEFDTEETVNLSDFTLPLDTLEEFSEESTIASRGFLYDDTGDSIRIIEMRNGREATRLSTGDIQRFIPIYLQK